MRRYLQQVFLLRNQTNLLPRRQNTSNVAGQRLKAH